MPFTLPLNVTPADADELGHVNNVVWLRWVQEVSAAHWETLAPEALRAGLKWVVRRHELDYLGAAFPGDRLVAETWVGETGGVTSVRHVVIRNEAGKELLRATTTWIAWDPVAGRPKRIDGPLKMILVPGEA